MEPPVLPSPEDIREELNAICSHKRFARSDRVCHFLQFIVEQRLRGNSVNEQLIGVKVFGRRAGYDSGNDTIVRTQAVDLRRRLEHYYEENPNARVRISVPRGGYNPTFAWVDGNRSEHSSGSSAAPPGNSQTAPEISEEQAITLPEPLGLRADTWFARRWAILLAGSLLLAAAAGLFFARLRKPAHLKTRNTIVLADFVNTTGEDIFDGTLKHALAVQLSQSPFLNILSDVKVAATLKLMNRPTNERLTQQLAREICQRANSNAFLAGSISTSGTDYVIGLKALNCQTGDTLASVQAQAPNRDSVLTKLQQTGNQLRERLGESLASIRKFDTPLVQATTSSLEALKAFTDATEVRKERGEIDAVPHLKRAIDLDPNFAECYTALGYIYRNSHESGLARANLKKAFELRDRVTERERFHIEGAYYEVVTGELGKSIQSYKEWAQTYPLDEIPHMNLDLAYNLLGKQEKAAAEEREALRLDPDNAVSYGNLMNLYLLLGRPDEAKAIYDQAQARGLASHDWVGLIRYYLAFAQGDEAGMRAQAAWAIGRPGVEDEFFSIESDTEAFYGHLGKARELSKKAVDLAKHNREPESAALWALNAALREAEFGNTEPARRDAKEALSLSAGRNVELMFGFTLARAGEVQQPNGVMQNLNQEYPLDTILQHYWLPTIRAAVDLGRGNPQRAIEVLTTTSAYDLGTPPPLGGTMYPTYIRGLAYLKARQPQAATEQFTNILQHCSILQNFPLGALAHVQLARALAASDDTAGARKEYQDFFALWKDANPDIPILQQAKQEYAKLRFR